VKQREILNFIEIGFTGRRPSLGEMYSFTVLSSFFLAYATEDNSRQMLMYNGSKDFV